MDRLTGICDLFMKICAPAIPICSHTMWICTLVCGLCDRRGIIWIRILNIWAPSSFRGKDGSFARLMRPIPENMRPGDSDMLPHYVDMHPGVRFMRPARYYMVPNLKYMVRSYFSWKRWIVCQRYATYF